MSIFGKVIRKILPRPVGTALSSFKILELDYGHFYSSWKWRSVDRDNQPIPWYTYPAIEYIKQLDFSEKRIFEYGSGSSSLFWSQVAKEVISIENKWQWYEKIASHKARNLEIKFIPDKESYVNSILEHPDFDVIIIDGFCRSDCAKQALQKLNSGGFIILDNSDKYPRAAEQLHNSALIQVDMSGFGPIAHYTWTTSFFLHREFNFAPNDKIQPAPGIGSLGKYEEE